MCVMFSTQAKACQLTFAVSNTFPPHHIQDDNNNWRGVAMDLFRWLANGAGCSVNVVNVPWDRTIKMLEQGQVDAVSLFTQSKEREAFAHFIGPHYHESIVVIVSASKASTLNTPKQLLSFKGFIGKTPGTNYGSELQRLLDKPHLDGKLIDFVANENRINTFKAGRVDAILEEAAVAQYLFENGQLDAHQHKVKLEFALNPVYFGFSKKSINAQQIEALKNSWNALLKQDALNNVYQRYGVDYSDIAASAGAKPD